MIICDTDVIVDILRGQPVALAWLASVREETVSLPGIVLMELIQGCRTKSEQQRMQKALKDYPLLWPSREACNKALKHFSAHYLSHGIGILDAIIAEITVEAGFPLYTFNQKHYLPHPQLQIIQPYTR
ncbi:MAG: PIN domain-containing protein [Desulfuromonadales bacterium]